MEQIGSEDELDLRPILKFLVGWLWLVALASILSAAAGAALAYDYDFNPSTAQLGFMCLNLRKAVALRRPGIFYTMMSR